MCLHPSEQLRANPSLTPSPYLFPHLFKVSLGTLQALVLQTAPTLLLQNSSLEMEGKAPKPSRTAHQVPLCSWEEKVLAAPARRAGQNPDNSLLATLAQPGSILNPGQAKGLDICREGNYGRQSACSTDGQATVSLSDFTGHSEFSALSAVGKKAGEKWAGPSLR